MWNKLCSLSFFSGSSIVLGVVLWPILCYNFVLNCMQIMGYAMLISKFRRSTFVDDYLDPSSPWAEVSLSLTMYLALTICEGILVIGLVIQFMSSFDYLTRNDGGHMEYESHWLKCHRKVLLVTGIVLAVKLTTSFYFLSVSTLHTDSLLELYAIAANFIFLLISVNVITFVTMLHLQTEGTTRLRSTSPSISTSTTIHVNMQALNDVDDKPPSYSEVVKESTNKESNNSPNINTNQPITV